MTRDSMGDQEDWFSVLGRQCLYIAFVTLTVVAVIWLAGGTDLRFALPVALVLLAGVNFLLVKLRCLGCGSAAKSFGVLVLLIWLGGWGVSQFYGTTYDGMRAHQTAVVALKNGWNPLYDPGFERGLEIRKKAERMGELDADIAVQQRVLQMAHELEGNFIVGNGYKINSFYILGAAFFGFWNELEAAKFVHLLFMLAAWGLTYRYLKERKSSSAFWVAAVFSANPVLLYQWSSFMYDGLVYSMFQIFFFSVLGLLDKPASFLQWLEAVCSGVLLATVKISGFSYFLALLFVLVVLFAFRAWMQTETFTKIRWVILACIVGFLADSVFKSWNLRQFTVHNISIASIKHTMMQRDHSRPGLAGIPEVAHQNKFQHFLWSHASITHINPRAFRLKIPGTVEKEEFRQLYRGHGEYRTGGFGPLYSLMLVFAAIMLLNRPSMLRSRVLGISILFILLVGWMSPVWWARWAAYLWMLPLLPLTFVKESEKSLPVFRLTDAFTRGHVLLVVSIINVCMVFTPYLLGRWEIRNNINQLMSDIASQGQVVELHASTFPVNHFWFRRHGGNPRLVLRDERELASDDSLHSLPSTSSRFRVLEAFQSDDQLR